MTDAVAAPIRRRMPAAERAEQLLNVADELITTQGFDDTSIEDIARAAGVTRPIVYQHFGSKEGVFLACIERARRELRTEFEPIFERADDPETAVREAAAIWFDIVERDPARWKVFFSSALPLTGTLSDRISERVKLNGPLYIGAVERWAPEGTPSDVIEVVAVMITGSADQLARWWLEHSDVSKQIMVDTFVTFCMAGVAPWLHGSAK